MKKLNGTKDEPLNIQLYTSGVSLTEPYDL